jgi:hypothetical protein
MGEMGFQLLPIETFSPMLDRRLRRVSSDEVGDEEMELLTLALKDKDV